MLLYRDRQAFVNATAEIAEIAERAGEQAVSVTTFDEAADYTAADLNRLIVIETAEDVTWWASNTYYGHQDLRVRLLIEEVLEEWSEWEADQRRRERRLALM